MAIVDPKILINTESHTGKKVGRYLGRSPKTDHYVYHLIGGKFTAFFLDEDDLEKNTITFIEVEETHKGKNAGGYTMAVVRKFFDLNPYQNNKLWRAINDDV